MAAARFGMPLTGHMLHGILPFYPSLPGNHKITYCTCRIEKHLVEQNCYNHDIYLHSYSDFELFSVIDGEFNPPTSPAYIQQQMKNLEQPRTSATAPSVITAMYPGTPITDAQVAQARLHR